MKHGFTLIELLVYMAIMGFIIVVAGRVYSDSTGMRIRTQSMTKAMESASAAAAVLKEDIGRMGVKVWKGNNSANSSVFTVNENVYRNLSNNDASSFALTRNSGQFDELSFNAMDFNTDGTFLAVREIRYSVNQNRELSRQCRTLDGDESDECLSGSQGDGWEGIPSTLIVANVDTFSLNPSIPGVSPADGLLASSIEAMNVPDVLFSSEDYGFALAKRPAGGNVLDISVFPEAPAASKSITLSGFSRNEPEDANFAQALLAGPSETECKEFEFFPGETYAIDFDLTPPVQSLPDDFCHICLFQAGEDHIALGLRRKSNLDEQIGVPDFVLSPSPVQEIDSYINDIPKIRHQKFSVPEQLTACVSLKFAFYSKMVSGGKFQISNFKVYRKKDEAYHFATGDDAYAYNPELTSNYSTKIADKADVKAFELELKIKIRDEGAKTKVVIPVPSNGVFAVSTPL